MTMKRSNWLLAVVVVASLLLGSCGTATTVAPAPTEPGGGGAAPAPTAAPTMAPEMPTEVVFDRSETLYTGGKQWGPVSNWNPLMTGNYAMGTLGLVYETLFLYDPLTDKFMPWLATSGEWTDDVTYTLTTRDGVTWSDGEPFSAADVKFTFELGQTAALNFSTLWDWLDSIDMVDDQTLKFNFSEPLYQEWASYLYTVPILPQHLWEGRDAVEVATGANENPIGTGAYLYHSTDQVKQVWERNDSWWAGDAMGYSMAPKYIVDLVNTSNENSLGLVLQGQEDLNNNYLPGISTLQQGGYALKTYFDGPPYHLPANTAWLDMNLQKAPLDDVNFRRALAYSINVDDIVSRDYGNMVEKANPTGLLPTWDKYVDQAVVDELGISYDPAMAKKILADNGYKDVDGDGLVEMPDGSPIELKIIVPNGWSDWMEAIRIISTSAQAAGINVVTDFPDFNGYLDARLQGTFDLAIDNQQQIGNTPWGYYHFIFYDKLADIPSTQGGNYGRYDNPEAFALVTELDKVPVDDIEGMQAVISKLQRIQLTDLPILPLWYNGAWAQFSTAYWTNWPSADGANYFPVTWNGYWNMTAILMLEQLEPVSE
jgi:peptide/nickel transport system substrate-binding protein